MKNIQRFKLPVIVAAGLHGALFLSIPATPAHHNGRQDTPVVLPLVSLSRPEITEIPEPQNGEPGTDGGGRTISTLPDYLVTLPDPNAFTTPVVRLDPIKGLAVDLSQPPGIGGTGPGSWTGPGVGAPPIIDVGMLDRVPRATVQPAPDYPPGLRHEGTTGSVTVEFVVDREGKVVRAEALRYTHREFVDPAIRAVLKWRFESGRQRGAAASFRMAVPIEFSVNRN